MRILLVSALAVLVFSPQLLEATQPHHNSPHKNSHLGFFGSRGKRSASSLETSKDLDYSNSEEKKSHESLTVTTIVPQLQDFSQLTGESPKSNNEENFVPVYRSIRTPSGFFGMRGKKESNEMAKRALLGLQSLRDRDRFDSEYMEGLPKRAPSQGFVGMRGKKFYDDEYGGGANKRAPMGFQGMRGKKSGPDEDFNQEEDLTQTSEEDIEYFQKLQSERELLKHLNALMLMENEEYTDDMEKRAPSQGFHGMRGKKLFEQAFGWQGNDLSNQENYDQDIEKRAPSQGFHGMRGKKSVDNFDYMEYEKRAPLGFQGMRGKKDQYLPEGDQFTFGDSKRAPMAGFFGMRGKKQPLGSGYFGVRGKKPYEFRGKFVGVRGKKTPDSPLQRLQHNLDDLELENELTPSQLEESEIMSYKRGPSGFVGMRG